MIDTHTHLFVEEFAEDLPQVVERAKAAGVEYAFLPNIDDTTVDAMLKVCADYPGYCFPLLGYHPTSVDGNSMPKVMEMKSLLVEGHPYVGIGEVGLDLYWDKTYLKEQQAVLDEQIQWALEWNLPLIVHCREAFPQLLQVLEPYKQTSLSGIFHSFTGTEDDAAGLLEYSHFMLGMNGVVTYKKSTLPAALKTIPLERLVLETDSPYLPPVPFRGKRNETSYVRWVAMKLAELYEVSLGEIERTTTENALKVFKNTGQVFKVY